VNCNSSPSIFHPPHNTFCSTHTIAGADWLKTTKMSLIVDGIDLDALNYTIKVPYNGTSMTGGDSLHADLNIFYDVSLPLPNSRPNTRAELY
jgi:hypothetical protein